MEGIKGLKNIDSTGTFSFLSDDFGEFSKKRSSGASFKGVNNDWVRVSLKCRSVRIRLFS